MTVTFPSSSAEDRSRVDGGLSDFALSGKEFEGLRKIASRIVGAKTVLERHLTTAPRDALRAYADLVVEFDRLNCLGERKLRAEVNTDEKPNLFETEEIAALQRPERFRSASIVQQLLMVAGFFPSVMWFLCLRRAAVMPSRAEEFLLDGRFNGVLRGKGCDQWWLENKFLWFRIGLFNRTGAVVLQLLIDGWPRFCVQLWKCTPFVWGLKSYIRWQAHLAATSGQANKMPAEWDELCDLLATISHQEMHNREAVDALNACAPPGALEAEKEDIDFSPLFHAMYWRADEKALETEERERPRQLAKGVFLRRAARLQHWGASVHEPSP
uniref:Uncharacterized protein n=1 Tax=Chromera velia CCMP2878 TaxID=1169474 RepID=A0A0G4HI21_9ALVE|eukprot:Cvel_6938.t1-p1 / transcript=Cvel_6938.t1 / gene=Cvel_6938 / organism=Chromera_velia_CCMP2878 / gene_product=hypothetical protein / transcript_product=hypothetical protein / location=Cvel_scaffold351:42325-43400(+) / protein_length=326 / sequence_SO=supercontig / SO=protein_coding / is_pseudo=false